MGTRWGMWRFLCSQPAAAAARITTASVPRICFSLKAEQAKVVSHTGYGRYNKIA